MRYGAGRKEERNGERKENNKKGECKERKKLRLKSSVEGRKKE
jgi:hypothetical protein